MEKIRIEGIKLSDELFQMNVRNSSHSTNILPEVCRTLASNQINMPFLSFIRLKNAVQMSCCVAAEDEARVKTLMGSKPGLRETTEFISSVGLVSIFPHKSSMKILGLSLYALSKARIPLYGLGSSLSALTFVTEYGLLDEGAEALEEYLELPPGQRPFRPQIRVKQSRVVKEE